MTLNMHLRINSMFSDMSLYILDASEEDISNITDVVDSYWENYKAFLKTRKKKDPRKKINDFLYPGYNQRIDYKHFFMTKISLNSDHRSAELRLKFDDDNNKELLRKIIEYMGAKISKETYHLLYE